jgi:hypothetical protein
MGCLVDEASISKFSLPVSTTSLASIRSFLRTQKQARLSRGQSCAIALAYAMCDGGCPYVARAALTSNDAVLVFGGPRIHILRLSFLFSVLFYSHPHHTYQPVPTSSPTLQTSPHSSHSLFYCCLSLLLSAGRVIEKIVLSMCPTSLDIPPLFCGTEVHANNGRRELCGEGFWNEDWTSMMVREKRCEAIPHGN